MAYSPDTTLWRTYKASGLNLNSVADAATFTGLPARFKVARFTLHNASTTPVLAQVSLRDAASGGGNLIVTAATITALTANTKTIDMTIALGDVIVTSALYARCAVVQGSGLTADCFIDIIDLT